MENSRLFRLVECPHGRSPDVAGEGPDPFARCRAKGRVADGGEVADQIDRRADIATKPRRLTPWCRFLPAEEAPKRVAISYRRPAPIQSTTGTDAMNGFLIGYAFRFGRPGGGPSWSLVAQAVSKLRMQPPSRNNRIESAVVVKLSSGRPLLR